MKTTTYITDPRFCEPVYREVGKWLTGVYLISSGLVVAGLARPGYCTAMGNLLANDQVPQAMINAFESAADMDLPSRLMR